MKKYLALFLTSLGLLSAAGAYAQDAKYGDNPEECKKYLSFYTDYYKQKDFKGAMTNWRKAYAICPASASSNLFLHGQTMMRDILDKDATLTAEHRAALVDSLLALFDERAAAYPKTAQAQMNRKALDVTKYVDDPDRKYAVYKQVIDCNGAYTDPQILFFYMEGTVSGYVAGKYDAEKVIGVYDFLMNLLDESSLTNTNSLAALSPEAKNYEKDKKALEDNAEAIVNARRDVEELFIASRVASCENLVALFTPRYENNPNDVDLIEKIVNMLNNAEDCNNNDLYFNAATALYAARPSYTAAYSLYRLNAARNNTSEAIKYLEEAIEFDESDAEKDARFCYELARYCYANNRNGKAVEQANKVVRLESGLEAKNWTGKAYMLIGRIWAANRCGGEIDRWAALWVATDYMQRARSADPEIADECGRYIAGYSANFPLAVDAANYDLVNGQSYTVSCGGLSATTTIRTRL